MTKLGPMGGMDAEVVDIGETEREFQADLQPLELMDMNMLTRTSSLQQRKQLAQGHRRRAGPR